MGHPSTICEPMVFILMRMIDVGEMGGEGVQGDKTSVGGWGEGLHASWLFIQVLNPRSGIYESIKNAQFP